MTTDFIIKPEFEAGGKWRKATLKINTTKAAKAYNDWFFTERNKGDVITISSNAYDELKQMAEMSHCSSVFG